MATLLTAVSYPVSDARAQIASTGDIATLASTIRQVIARARAGAAADLSESTAVAAVADVIVTADRPAADALRAVRLAIAEEGCVLTDRTWNRWGCAGLAGVAATIERSIGQGPTAGGGQGGAPIAAPPPFPGAGADYRPAVGV